MSYPTAKDSVPPKPAIERIATKVRLGLIQLTRLLIVLLSAAFVSIIIYAIGSRYLFGFSIIWIEEIARFLLAWIVFLGVSVALYEGGHMAMIALHQRFPFRIRKLLDAAFDLLMILFLTILFYHGLKLAISVIPQISPALRITYFWPYLSIPVGAALAIIQLFFMLYHDVKQVLANGRVGD